MMSVNSYTLDQKLYKELKLHNTHVTFCSNVHDISQYSGCHWHFVANCRSVNFFAYDLHRDWTAFSTDYVWTVVRLAVQVSSHFLHVRNLLHSLDPAICVLLYSSPFARTVCRKKTFHLPGRAVFILTSILFLAFG